MMPVSDTELTVMQIAIAMETSELDTGSFGRFRRKKERKEEEEKKTKNSPPRSWAITMPKKSRRLNWITVPGLCLDVLLMGDGFVNYVCCWGGGGGETAL